MDLLLIHLEPLIHGTWVFGGYRTLVQGGSIIHLSLFPVRVLAGNTGLGGNFMEMIPTLKNVAIKNYPSLVAFLPVIDFRR